MKTDAAVLAICLTMLAAFLVALAGSAGGIVVSGLPLFAWCIALAFALQWIAFVPAYLRKTERFFDLTGSVTYVTVVIVALLAAGRFDGLSLLIAGLVCIWALRLGWFLTRRIHRAGSDRRFDTIKPHFFVFLMTWTLQGLWVALTLSCGLAAITSTQTVPVSAATAVGALVWTLGFAIEVVADRQKARFRADPNNRARFISTGLWAWSRHPNYFGEIVLWAGIAIMALPTLEGWRYVTLISPVFVYILLTRISGVPMLEARADKKWGGDPAYERYKERTPALLLKPRTS